MSQSVVSAIRRVATAVLFAVIASVASSRPVAAQPCVSCWIDVYGGGFNCLTWFWGAEDCLAVGTWCVQAGICETIMQLDVAEDGAAYVRGQESEVGSLDKSQEPADEAVRRTCDGILLRTRQTDAAISEVPAPAVLTL